MSAFLLVPMAAQIRHEQSTLTPGQPRSTTQLVVTRGKCCLQQMTSSHVQVFHQEGFVQVRQLCHTIREIPCAKLQSSGQKERIGKEIKRARSVGMTPADGLGLLRLDHLYDEVPLREHARARKAPFLICRRIKTEEFPLRRSRHRVDRYRNPSSRRNNVRGRSAQVSRHVTAPPADSPNMYTTVRS